MVHSDNKGLVCPPRVAETQVMIIPVGLTKSLAEEKKHAVIAACKNLENALSQAGVRVTGDYRENYSPGFKFNDAELHGVPLQIEVGPRDVDKGSCIVKRRDNFEKESVVMVDASTRIPEILEELHNGLYQKAKKAFDEAIVRVYDVNDMGRPLNEKKLLIAPFCGREDCEDYIKDVTAKQSATQVDDKAPSMGAKSLCVPLEQPVLPERTKCAGCDMPAVEWTLFGRSY